MPATETKFYEVTVTFTLEAENADQAEELVGDAITTTVYLSVPVEPDEDEEDEDDDEDVYDYGPQFERKPVNIEYKIDYTFPEGNYTIEALDAR